MLNACQHNREGGNDDFLLISSVLSAPSAVKKITNSTRS